MNALIRSRLWRRATGTILVAAQIAEALAVTTYMHIIHMAPFFNRLPSDDQGYLKAAAAGRDVPL